MSVIKILAFFLVLYLVVGFVISGSIKHTPTKCDIAAEKQNHLVFNRHAPNDFDRAQPAAPLPGRE